MKLILVRHGQANEGFADDERTLTELGVQQIKNVAQALAGQKVKVAHVYHSGKMRAQQTAEILQQDIAPSCPITVLELLKPDSKPTALVDRLVEFDESSLMVGHLPHIREFAFELLGFQNTRALEQLAFNPGTVIIFSSDDSITWELDQCFEPEIV